MSMRQLFSGLIGAQQIAAVESGKLMPSDAPRGGAGLEKSGRVERNIDLALDTALGVPVGFTMTNDTKMCTHGSVL